MNDLPAQFRDAVQAFIERTGTPPARLGTEALGDPSFVLRLTCGRIPRLDTADKVLAFIGEEPLGSAFRAEIEAFIEITRTKPYVLGLDAAGDLSFVAPAATCRAICDLAAPGGPQTMQGWRASTSRDSVGASSLGRSE